MEKIGEKGELDISFIENWPSERFNEPIFSQFICTLLEKRPKQFWPFYLEKHLQNIFAMYQYLSQILT